MAASGYSSTPLARKLGWREGSRVHLVDAPPGLMERLAPLPAGIRRVALVDHDVDLVHAFVVDRARLASLLERLRGELRADAVLWISWPKKAARVATDVSENVVRELALPLGFVDIKVCAVDEVWSALKLVIRKALR